MNSPFHTAAVVCKHVFAATHPVLLVSKMDGDQWQFLCGYVHQGTADYRIVGIGHIIEREPTLQDVLDLPDNWDAERESVDSPWKRMPSLENQ